MHSQVKENHFIQAFPIPITVTVSFNTIINVIFTLNSCVAYTNVTAKIVNAIHTQAISITVTLINVSLVQFSSEAWVTAVGKAVYSIFTVTSYTISHCNEVAADINILPTMFSSIEAVLATSKTKVVHTIAKHTNHFWNT